jgi:hypothetical protein
MAYFWAKLFIPQVAELWPVTFCALDLLMPKKTNIPAMGVSWNISL